MFFGLIIRRIGKESGSEKGAHLDPVASGDVSGAGLEHFEQSVGDDFERGEREAFAVRRRRAGEGALDVVPALAGRVAVRRPEGRHRRRLDL